MKKVRIGVLLVGVAVLLGFASRLQSPQGSFQKVQQVESYLQKTSKPLCDTLAQWQKEGNFPTWHCGPTSWWMANELKRRFFPDLSIRADRGEGDCILFRIGSTMSGGRPLMDHCWVEVYWKGYVLWIDPTYAQFDRNPSILFAWFSRDQWFALERFKWELKASYSTPSSWGDEILFGRRMVNSGNVRVEWLNWALWLHAKTRFQS